MQRRAHAVVALAAALLWSADRLEYEVTITRLN